MNFSLAPFRCYGRYLLLSFLLLLAAFSGLAQQKPNIVFILADDLGYGDVSAFNDSSKIPTRHLDALAGEGMRFTDAHSNSAVCTPTRYGILTGRYAWRSALQNGVLWSYDPPLISPGRLTVAGLLRQNGYRTACIGKWHLGLGWQHNAQGEVDFSKPVLDGPITRGFDYFFGITASLDIPPYVYIENGKITASHIDSIAGTQGKGFWRAGPIGNDFRHTDVLDSCIAKSIAYIRRESRSGQPFFLYLALPSPHTPILPSPAFAGRTHTNAYGDYVLMTDDRVGRLLQALKEMGLEKNTLVIFTSDNGCSPAAGFEELARAGHHPSYVFRGEKADIFDGGHRIPFIARWPGRIRPGSVCDSTICLTDFMATCADLLQVSLPDSAAEDSYSLLPLLLKRSGENYGRRSTVHHSIDGCFAIREGNWKLEFCRGSGGWSAPNEKQAAREGLPPIQLYDLSNDVGERHNVADDHPDIVARLRSDLDKIIRDGRSRPGPRGKNDVEVVWER